MSNSIAYLLYNSKKFERTVQYGVASLLFTNSAVVGGRGVAANDRYHSASVPTEHGTTCQQQHKA